MTSAHFTRSCVFSHLVVQVFFVLMLSFGYFIVFSVHIKTTTGWSRINLFYTNFPCIGGHLLTVVVHNLCMNLMTLLWLFWKMKVWTCMATFFLPTYTGSTRKTLERRYSSLGPANRRQVTLGNNKHVTKEAIGKERCSWVIMHNVIALIHQNHSCAQIYEWPSKQKLWMDSCLSWKPVPNIQTVQKVTSSHLFHCPTSGHLQNLSRM